MSEILSDPVQEGERLLALADREQQAFALLRAAGYEPHVMFNAMTGKERMLFDDDHGRQADVFVGSFRMSHEIPFRSLAPADRTLPLAELLVTKLQIIERNEKDVRDAVLLLHGEVER